MKSEQELQSSGRFSGFIKIFTGCTYLKNRVVSTSSGLKIASWRSNDVRGYLSSSTEIKRMDNQPRLSFGVADSFVALNFTVSNVNHAVSMSGDIGLVRD